MRRVSNCGLPGSVILLLGPRPELVEGRGGTTQQPHGSPCGRQLARHEAPSSGTRLQCRAQMPGGELVLAVAQLFALAALPGRGGEDQFEDALAHLLDTCLAIEDLAAID